MPGASALPLPDEGSVSRLHRLRRPDLRALNPAIISGIVLIVALSFGLWNVSRDRDQGDYFQFWAVGRLAGTGVTDIYSTSARATLGAQINTATDEGTSVRAAQAAQEWQVLNTTGTPFLYAVFGTLSTGDYDLDSGTWELIGLLALIAASVGLCLAFGYSGVAALAVTAMLVGTSGALVSDVRTGNVNQVQVGILAAFFLLRLRWPTPRGDVAAGVLLGALIAFKPDLAPVAGFLVLLWFVDRRFGTLRRVLLGMVAGGLLAVAIGTIAWGSFRLWIDWLGSLAQLASGQYTVASGNYSLARVILEWSGVDVSLNLAIGLGATIIAAMVRARSVSQASESVGSTVEGKLGARRPPDPNAAVGREVLTVGAAIALVLMASPLAWLHYFLLLVPLQIYLLRPGDPEGRPGPIPPILRQAAVSISVVLLAFVPLDTVLGASPTADALEAIVAGELLFAMAVLWLAADPGPLAEAAATAAEQSSVTAAERSAVPSPVASPVEPQPAQPQPGIMPA